MPTKHLNHNTRSTDKVTLFHTKHNFFKICFCPSTVTEWNMLDLYPRNSVSVFKKYLAKFSRSCPNSVFNCQNCEGIEFLTSLHHCLSHLHKHKFKYSKYLHIFKRIHVYTGDS